ncbi:MAG: DUF3179 domain-containing protein [Planctomycetes bacterium]|nr:DUF3179 domain-containing protein [Planctomycetota bacterium]
MRPPGERLPGKLLTFRSGGWVLVLAALVSAAVVFQVVRQVRGHREHAFGDGKNPATYLFASEPTLLPRGTIVASGMPRNAVPALVEPMSVPLDNLLHAASRKVKKLLKDPDRVIGVHLDGEARCYPIRFLNFHEVSNDTLGGRKIAVTYHPLCDSVAVFDREVEGRVLELRVSGLLWNSSALYFDRRDPPGGESLWSQLLARAVTGPDAAAGRRFTLLPCVVVTLGEWRRRHPDTSVLAPDPVFLKQYPREPYAPYYGSATPRFPVEPYPPPPGRPAWSRAVLGPAGALLDDPGDAGEASASVSGFAWALVACRPADR